MAKMHSNSLAGVMAAVLGIAIATSATIAAPKDTEKEQSKVRRDAQGDPLPPWAIARLGTQRLRGCRGPVVFSPDGKYIVTAGGEGGAEAVFWDRSSGRRIKALTAKESIFDLAFSPDGKKLAVVGNGGFFNSVWDVDTGKELFSFKGKKVAFGADGKELISTYSIDMNSKVRTFDVGTGRQLTEWDLQHPFGEKLILSPDGRFAAISHERNKGFDGVIFNLAKRAEIKKLRLAKDPLIGFSGDGLRFLVGSEEGLSVWEWSSGKQLHYWARNGLSPAALSHDGRRVAWIGADENGIDSVWTADVEAVQPRPIRAMTFDNSIRLSFSPDGRSVAALTGGNAVVLFDSRSGRDQLPVAAHDDRLWKVEYSSDGRHIMTRDSLRLLVWEAATGRLLCRLPNDLPEGETILLNTLSHRRILTATLADGTLHLRDAATAKERRRLEGKEGYVADAPWDVSAVSSDGSSAAILGPAGIRVYDLDTGAIRCQFTRDHPIWGMEFSADGRILEVTVQDFKKGLTPLFYDARTGRKVEAPADAGLWKRRDGRWRSDSEKAKSRLRELKLLDASGRPAFTGADGFITHVQESPSGRFLAVGGRTGLLHVINDRDKNFIRIWDMMTRRPILVFDEKHQIGGFSPEERTFISIEHSTGTIHLWEIATGRERLRLAGHMPGDVTIGFRPDARVLVSGGADTQVFLWDLTGRAPDGVRHETRHSRERLRELWQALAGDDAAEAYRAMWALVDAPAQTVAWMHEQLPPIAPVERRDLMRLLADLDSNEFAVRSKASEELEHLGELAGPALRDALATKPSLECRRRCEDLLAKLGTLSSRRLRAVRAVEALEHIGTAEARTLLEKLSQGAPEARQTQEASAALKRLQGTKRSRDR